MLAKLSSLSFIAGAHVSSCLQLLLGSRVVASTHNVQTRLYFTIKQNEQHLQRVSLCWENCVAMMSAEEVQQPQSAYEDGSGPGAPTPLSALEVRHLITLGTQ